MLTVYPVCQTARKAPSSHCAAYDLTRPKYQVVQERYDGRYDMAGIRTLTILTAMVVAWPRRRRLAQVAAGHQIRLARTERLSLGRASLSLCFSLGLHARARWLRTEALDRQADRFDHIRHLEDATSERRAPNNDTLYSRAWVYLKDEPSSSPCPRSPIAITRWRLSTSWATISPMSARARPEPRRETMRSSVPDWKGTLPAGVTALPASRRHGRQFWAAPM